jgi:hypothetical protein
VERTRQERRKANTGVVEVLLVLPKLLKRFWMPPDDSG